MLCEAKQQLPCRLSAVKGDSEPLRQLTEDIDARGLRRLFPDVVVGIVLNHRRSIFGRACRSCQMLGSRNDGVDIFGSGDLLRDGPGPSAIRNLSCCRDGKSPAAHLAIGDQGIVGPTQVGCGVLAHPEHTRQSRDAERPLDEVLRADGGVHC